MSGIPLLEEVKQEVKQETKQNNKEIVLTEEQKSLILNEWNTRGDNPPSIKELTDKCFGEGLDGRGPEGRAIRKFLASRKLKQKSTHNRPILSLTDSQKQFIENHISDMTPLEMARTLYNNPNLRINAIEVNDIKKFIVDLNIPRDKMFKPGGEEQILDRYTPPKKPLECLYRINRFCIRDITIDEVKKDKKLLECVGQLSKFCHTPRFVSLMDNFERQTDKELFESSFVRYVWDKPDLSEEEIDSYINLCLDIVNHTRLQLELDRLKEMRDQCLDDSEGKRLSLSLVEMMGKIYKEMDDNQKRQERARETLTGKRKDRIDNKIKENASVLQLVDAWRDEEKRKRLVDIAERRKKIVQEEIKRLETLDDFKAQLYGIDKASFDME